MKTAYIKPQTEILNINVEPMMAASPSLATTLSDKETDTYAAKENSFSFDVWGLDDEE